MTAKLIVETTARYRLKFINCKFYANFGAQKCSTAVYILMFELQFIKTQEARSL